MIPAGCSTIVFGKTARRGYLDHAFMPNCTIWTHLRRRASLDKDTAWNAFWCNFYILVLEIPINFQTDVQCAEKVISKIILHKRWDLEKSWHSCHTWVYLTSKVLRTLDPERPDKRDKTGFAAWPGGRGCGWGNFFAWSSASAWQCGLWGGLSNGTVLPMLIKYNIQYYVRDNK